MLIIADNQADNKRLDIYLATELAKLSRSQWQKKIKTGEVLVNNKMVGAGYKLKTGDKVKLLISNFQFSDNNKTLKPIAKRTATSFKNLKDTQIIFETSDYVVVNKPAGIVVHPDNKYKQDTLIDWLLGKYPAIKGVGEAVERPGIVHRLDKDVSGLIVVALNQQMFEHFKREFQERRVGKEYWVLVHGVVKNDEGEIKVPIKRSKVKGVFVADSTFSVESRTALTRYEVIKRYQHFTLLKVKILTGRTHQIRVHLSSIGHSVAGDKLYATHDVRVKKKGVSLGRLWLHAAKLSFNDLNFQRQQFEIGLPAELKDFLTQLK